MNCAFCGLEFAETEGRRACGACPLAGCGMVCCPRCGYETLPEPRWLAALRTRRKTP